MLHILLLILKIIGIVLLVILGTLLLGIACALFVPVRYRIEAVRKEGEGEPPVAVRVKVTWLLHLINLLVCFNSEIFVRVRIFLITIFRMPKKERHRCKTEKEGKNRKKRGRERADKTKRQEAGAESGHQPEISVEAVREDGTSQKSGEGDSRTNQAQEDVVSQERSGNFAEMTQTWTDDEEQEESEESAEAQKKPGLLDKLRALPKILRALFAKIRGLFENIEYTINSFCDKIRSVSDTIEYYREIVEGEPFKRSFALCSGELLAVFKSLRPQKLEASLIVGMDDPAATGEILAVCGMLYPLIGSHVDVRGDFENKRLEGQVLIVGKLRAFTFLRTAVRIYFNKDIRKLYRLIKKEAVNG